MKKKMLDAIKTLGGTGSFSGKQWPTVLYLDHPVMGKDWMIAEMTKMFTRHTQIKFE